jgi:hypothetical protein
MVERVTRAIYDELEGPVNNQDAGRQMRQWELAKRLARAAISAMQSDPGIPIYKTEPDPKPIRDLAVRDVEE